MASSVRTLSNHYETLRISPSATSEEIVRAFSAQMRNARVRPDITVARLAELSVAYETLRDPAKRRAYDESIGIRRQPAAPLHLNATPFIGSSAIYRLNQLAGPAPAARPEPKTPPAPQAGAEEPRVAAFIAASLREPAASEPRAAAAPLPEPQSAELSQATVGATLARATEDMEIEEGRLAIGRTGAMLAAGVVGVAILAAVAALPDRNPDKLTGEPTTAQHEPGVTVPLPPPDTQDTSAADEPFPASAVPAERAWQPRRAERRPARKATPVAAAPADGQQLAQSQADQGASPTVDTAADQPVAATPAVETVAVPASAVSADAKLPLPGASIARTIERIGYGCGSVVSSVGIEGSAGSYKITCSSGDTYRAAPVHGRYHFRRVGSH